MRIAQLGSFNTNIGDNAALFGARKTIESLINEPVEWVPVHLGDFHDKLNNIPYCIRRFKEISSSCQLLIIGGGGLIELNKPKLHTLWKLPVNEQILQSISIPIICHSVGLNIFHGDPPATEDDLYNLKTLITTSALFSVRSDGSKELIESLLPECTDVIHETPDPAIVSDFQVERKNEISRMVFQPAMNSNKSINKHRFNSLGNLRKLESFLAKRKIPLFAHTIKDYQFHGHKFLVKPKELSRLVQFDNYVESIQYYVKYDLAISMRGHGQMITLGMNIPGIYLSTQPKVMGLSEKAGLSDYTVALQGDNWLDNLKNCISKMESDSDYLQRWYEIRDAFVEREKLKLHQFNQLTLNVLSGV